MSMYNLEITTPKYDFEYKTIRAEKAILGEWKGMN